MNKLYLANLVLTLMIVVYLSAQAYSSRTIEADAVERYILNNPKTLIASLEAYNQQMESDNVPSSQEQAMLFGGEDDPKVGNPNAKIKIVEFFDYTCGYCHKMFMVKQQLIKANQDIQIISREMPMLSEKSAILTRASLAAYRTDPAKYMAYQGALFSLRGKQIDTGVLVKLAGSVGIDMDVFKKALDDDKKHDTIINANAKLARDIGVNVTPAYIIGNELIPGYISYENFNAKIAKKREATGG